MLESLETLGSLDHLKQRSTAVKQDTGFIGVPGGHRVTEDTGVLGSQETTGLIGVPKGHRVNGITGGLG